MTPLEIAAEVAEAELETAEYEEQRKARREAYLATLTKDARYYSRHKAKRKCDTAMRRAENANAIPHWLTEKHKRQILAVYEEAERLTEVTGILHEVDHLVPLFGQNRSGEVIIRGLHVPWNLRAIPRSLNRKRGDWFYIRDAECGIASSDGDDEIPF